MNSFLDHKRWLALLLIFVLGLGLLIGYGFGNREKVNSSANSITIRASNGSIQNELTKIEKRDIKGILETDRVNTYGQMFFKITDNEQTHIRLDLNNIPNQVKQTKSGRTKDLPTQLKVQLAKTTRDGTDFDYEEVGTINFDEPNKYNLRSGQFSTIIEKPLFNTKGSFVQRIELIAIKP